MDLTIEVERVKKELVELITAHLQANAIDIPTAQKMAADFLSILPVSGYNDLLTKMKDLSNNYVEVRTIYLEEITKYSESERQHALEQIRAAIAKGNMEHATKIASVLKGDAQ